MGNKIKKKKWVYIGEQEAKKDELEEIYDRIQRDRLAEVSE